ncbi:acyl-CoA dehydrogenase family protein [Actinoplanes sp. NPDC049118]|uniref:acyl-CoA dehydrogenase family protein n=1 Tax=Actinoplanes sp. NPDC049118 TaxID=3155769 RepID=UPI0033DC6C36
MRLAPSPEQEGFAAVLHDLLTAADLPAAAARWSDGDHAAGRAVWARLAEAGVTGLAVPSRWGGLDAGPADLVIACEELGHHALPGPVAESVAAVPALLAALGQDGPCEEWLPGLAAGRVVATLAAPPWLPYAVDAHAAGLVLLAEATAVRHGRIGAAHPSMDRSRRLFEISAGAPIAEGPAAATAVTRALNLGALACAAQLLGAGRAMLEAAVGYATRRTQFGRPIGQFQAVQHRLADVAVALEFARPLLYAAAAALAGGDTHADADRDVSAAKVACADAAHRAARAALQVHGALGYTQEHGLGRWLTRIRVLALAWGTPAQHRARVIAELTR